MQFHHLYWLLQALICARVVYLDNEEEIEVISSSFNPFNECRSTETLLFKADTGVITIAGDCTGINNRACFAHSFARIFARVRARISARVRARISARVRTRIGTRISARNIACVIASIFLA